MDLKELSKMDFKDLFQKGKGTSKGTGRSVSSVLGLDFGAEAVNAVRLKKSKGKIELLGAEILPLPDVLAESMDIPAALGDRYAALCSTFPRSTVRVFNYTPQGEYVLKDVVRENFNVSEEFRVGGILLKESRKDHLILGVSTPSEPVEKMLSLFSDGPPALCAIEYAGLSSVASFLFQKGAQTQSRTVCLIDGGTSSITVSFFVDNKLQIINQFDFGKASLLKEIEKGLGIDAETAEDIAKEGAVDISSFVQSTLGSVSKQLSISKEFVERQNRSRLSGCYLSGELALVPSWGGLLGKSMEIPSEVWNPFESFVLPESGLPETIQGREPLFASAVGVALSSMEVL